MSAMASSTRPRGRRSTARALYSPVEAIKLLKGDADGQVRRDRRGALPARPQRPPRRRAAARHADAPARHRPRDARRRLRRGRQGPRGGGGGRGRRRLGRPRREDRGRLPRLRRRDRDAGPDGQRRQARPRARPSRPDAEPEDRARSRSTSPRPSRDAKAGKLEYRTDRGANVHVPIGKKSFDERALVENYAALIDEIVRAKPASAKGRYIKGITVTSTMGPGVHVDPARTRGIVEELEEAAVPA